MTDSRLIKTDAIANLNDAPLYPTWKVPRRGYRMREAQRNCLPVKEKFASLLASTPIPATPFSSTSQYFEIDISRQNIDLLETMNLQFTLTNGGAAPVTLAPAWFMFSKIQTFINNSVIDTEWKPMAAWTRAMSMYYDEDLTSFALDAGFDKTTLVADNVVANGTSRTYQMPLWHFLEDVNFPLSMRDDKIVLRFYFATTDMFTLAGADIPTLSSIILWLKGANYTDDSDRQAVKSQVNNSDLMLRFADSVQEQLLYQNVVASVKRDELQLLTRGLMSHSYVYVHPTNPTATQFYLPQIELDTLDLLNSNGTSLISLERPLSGTFIQRKIGALLFPGKSFTNASLKQYIINFSVDPYAVENKGIALGQVDLDRVRPAFTPSAGVPASVTVTFVHKILKGLLLSPVAGIKLVTEF